MLHERISCVYGSTSNTNRFQPLISISIGDITVNELEVNQMCKTSESRENKKSSTKCATKK